MEDYNGNVFPRLHDACHPGNIWTVIWGVNIIFCEAVDSWDWEQWHFDLKNVNDLTVECRFCQKLLVREKVRERKKSDKNLSFQTHFEKYHKLYYDECVKNEQLSKNLREIETKWRKLCAWSCLIYVCTFLVLSLLLYTTLLQTPRHHSNSYKLLANSYKLLANSYKLLANSFKLLACCPRKSLPLPFLS